MKIVSVTTNNNDLEISIFDDSHLEVEPLIMNGETAYHYLGTFKYDKINKIKKTSEEDKAIIEYENYILKLEKSISIANEEHQRLVDQILKKTKNEKKKVTRKNKHIGKAVAISAIAFTIAMSVAKPDQIDARASDKLFENMSNGVTTSDVIEENTLKDSKALDIVKQAIDNQTPKNPKKEDELIPPEKPETNIAVSEVQIEYDDRSTSEDAAFTRENYWDVIDYYSKMYGLDSNLILALATQERGIHSETMDDDGATGLMQIQNEAWSNETLSAYNFDTNSWEEITIDEGSLGDLNYNVKVGCIIFQDCLKNNNYNIIASIQAYNMGYGTTNIILNQYCEETGQTRDEVLEDQTNIDWLNYRSMISYGDPNYVENVLSYYNGDGIITMLKPDGNSCSVKVKQSKENNKLL